MENMDISPILRPYLSKAKKNVEKLMAHFKTIDVKIGEIECNPMTEVTEILKELEVFNTDK